MRVHLIIEQEPRTAKEYIRYIYIDLRKCVLKLDRLRNENPQSQWFIDANRKTED